MLRMDFGKMLAKDAVVGMKALQRTGQDGLFFLLCFSGKSSYEVFDKVLGFVLFFLPLLSSREE